MTDEELVKMARLAQRDDRMATGALYGDLADRIEQLQQALKDQSSVSDRLAEQLEQLVAINEAARADAKEAEAYAEELEKQLNICRMAQVVMENGIAQVEGEFARAMKHIMDYSNDRHLVAFARAALAEIEGEKT